MPDGAYQIVELRLIDGTLSYSLPVRPKFSVVRAYPNVASDPTTLPAEAFEENGSIFLHPRPIKDYVIRGTFISNPSTLSADSDVPFTDVLDSAVVAHATATVMRSLQKFTEAQRWDQEFERQFASALAADWRKPALRRDREQHPGVGNGWTGPIFQRVYLDRQNGRRF
jgi:hypothetical protein